MKKLLLLSLSVLFIVSVNAQTKDAKAIESALSKYVKLTENQQFEELMEYVHPTVFDFVSKEVMVTAFESMFEDPTLEFKFDGFEITKIHPTVKDGKEKYALIDYMSGMNMKMIGDKFTQEVLEASKTMFDAQFGAENVELLADNSFQINAPKTIIASLLKGEKQWKFLEQSTQMQGILDAAIPSDIQEALNRSKSGN